jgi:hypothetical protein
MPATDPVVVCPVGVATGTEDSGWHVYALGGIALLHASPANNQAFQILTNQNTGPALPSRSTTATQHVTFRHDLAIAPQVRLGVVDDDGFGVRVRYWYFHEANAQTAVNADFAGNSLAIQSILPAPFTIISSAAVTGFLPPGTGAGALVAGVAPDIFTARQAVTLHVGDLEVSQSLTEQQWTFQGSAGMRYAQVGQTYDVLRNNAGGFALGTQYLVDQETSQARHDFDGLGPTLCGDIIRQIGSTCLALYTQGRGSLLVGRHRLSTTTTRRGVLTSRVTGLIDNTVQLNDRRATTDVLPVGELEMGVELASQMGNFNVLLRAGFQAQTWWGAGSVLGTAGDLDLYGATFLLGVEY